MHSSGRGRIRKNVFINKPLGVFKKKEKSTAFSLELGEVHLYIWIKKYLKVFPENEIYLGDFVS